MLKALAIISLLAANSEMQLVGKGELNWMFWDVYEAELRAPDGSYDESKPLALKLTYKMAFLGKEIAARSVQEIRGQRIASKEELMIWGKKMTAIFPDVKNGDSLTGVFSPEGTSVFYYNDKQLGEIEDAKFTKAFFGIWLGEKTSEPALRAKLLAVSDE